MRIFVIKKENRIVKPRGTNGLFWNFNSAKVAMKQLIKITKKKGITIKDDMFEICEYGTELIGVRKA